MRDEEKTKNQLIQELNKLRRQWKKSQKSYRDFDQTKRDLQECEEKYRNLVERANDGIAIIEEMRFKYVNPRLAEMGGYTVQELIDKPFVEYIDPDELPMVAERHKRRLAGEEVPSIYESAIKGKNGQKVLVEFNVNVSRSNGKSTSFVIIRDITRRKKAEQIQFSVYRISEVAHSAESLEEFYEAIHSIIADLMPAKNNFYIALYDESSDSLYFPYFVDEFEENPGPQKLGKGLTEYVLKKGESLLASPKTFQKLEETGDVESIGPPSIDWLGVPLKIRGRTIGVLTVQSYTEGVRYTEEEKNILTFIAEQVAMAIERKQTAQALKKSEEKYRTIAENVDIGIYRTTAEADGNFIEANPSIVRIFGYKDKKEFMGLSVADLYQNPQDRKKFQEKMERDGFVKYEELALKRKDGTPFLGSICAVAVKDESGKIKYFDGIVEDITDRKLAEEKVRSSLSEKEVLLREIHHRVKNNLQIISSLLNLQSRQVKDEPALDMFQESRNRVRSMALVHEKLYRSKDLAKVDFSGYIQSLATHLFMVYGIKTDAVRLDIDVQDVYLNINTSIPCGLIVNELISNSLKHAFTEGNGGNIRIVLRPENGNKFKLVVSDNGCGLPQNVDVTQTESLGLQLVSMLVSQLQGSIHIERNKGTSFQIIFSELDYGVRH
jgi:PAS domain S-box-containing protein